MQTGQMQSPLNPLPPVLWVLALPIIATEAVFALGRIGVMGGAQGAGLRLSALRLAAYPPQLPGRMLGVGDVPAAQLYRLVSYAFVHASPVQALMVLVFLLALGNMVARVFRPWSVVALYLGSVIGGALIYSAAAGMLDGGGPILAGGYPGVYGLIGAFTFLLWTRLAQLHENRMRAFTLIAFLLGFQLVFAVVFGGIGLAWIAEIAGFAVGFLLSFVLVPGGVGRVLAQLRRR